MKCPDCGAEGSIRLVEAYPMHKYWNINDDGEPTTVDFEKPADLINGCTDEWYSCTKCAWWNLDPPYDE
jgi:hypothetical protein